MNYILRISCHLKSIIQQKKKKIRQTDEGRARTLHSNYCK